MNTRTAPAPAGERVEQLEAQERVDLEPRQIVHRYIEGVLTGEVVACRWLRLAAQRHMDDLQDAEERGLYFDEDEAQLVVDFFALLKHSKGEWAGRAFHLQPWQMFIVWCLFGWRRKKDRLRRFRTAYLEIARKNGKSTLAAGIGLYLLVMDGEPGAEVYSAATKRDQAAITHGEAMRMVKASPPLRKRVTLMRNNLNVLSTASKYEPLSADTDSMDGLNVHAAIVDELHAHKTRDLWDLLDTATGSRRQPLIVAITTAGFDRQTICYWQHEYTQKVLEGTVADDTFFGLIFGLDEEDAWDDPEAWLKANPNLGTSKKWDDMHRKAARAKEMPTALNAFLRRELNVWTEAATRWLSRDHWDLCGMSVEVEGLRGRTCYGGLDLSSTTDISGYVLVFPPQHEGEVYHVLCRFFVPDEAMHLRSHRDRVPYETWVRQGYITTTPGNVIDYSWILDQIDQDAQAFDVREIAFDRWGATKIVQELQDLGGEDFVVQFGQGFRSMNAPMKELEKIILGHLLAHGNNPVLTWMADNLVANVDPAGNIKPDKARSTEKIDGMVALIMGLDRALRHEPKRRSVYESRGVMSV